MIEALPPAEMVQVLSTAETFQAWATGAVAITTAVAIVVGGGWALWRYVLPGPFGCAWEWEPPNCSVRVLPSRRYIYMVQMAVRNASSAVHTMRRLTMGIYFPDQGTIDEIASRELTSPQMHEVEANVRCPPHILRTCCVSTYEIDSLHHVVFVVWKAEYRTRRILGLFGQRDDATEQGAIPVPVDAQSLALCAEAGKERHPTPGTTP